MPPNEALAGLCDGMIEAWNIQADAQAAILLIIEDVTYNICDQRFHEFYIRENQPHIQVVRKTLTEVAQQGRLGADRQLIVLVTKNQHRFTIIRN